MHKKGSDTDPQWRPMTSNTKHLWWLHKNIHKKD